jgi:signal transduction histidine kinase
VNRIQTVVEQGSAIVRALLGLGRLNENELISCLPAQILEETKRVLLDRFPTTVQLQIEPLGELPEILCSKEVLQQMLINLILNAADAINNSGTIFLEAETKEQLPAGLALEPERASNYVVLSVRDEGVGIGPESLPRIFEPFYTTKAFSSRRGTGLGLSMVYELAKGMGYGLSVESEPGQGSTFSIIVPVRNPA